jgi:TRAP-type C4-dicarboxylate transport system substrate-binding protein
MTGIVVSNKWLHSLPADLQALLKTESQIFGDKASENILKAEDEMIAKMQNEGKKVIVVDTDITPFKEACAYVPEKLGLMDAYTQVKSVLGGATALENEIEETEAETQK